MGRYVHMWIEDPVESKRGGVSSPLELELPVVVSAQTQMLGSALESCESSMWPYLLKYFSGPLYGCLFIFWFFWLHSHNSFVIRIWYIEF